MRDRFTFFRSYGEALENLPDDERLKCYDAIYRYAIFGEEPELDGIAKGFFTLMKPNIDKSIKRAEAGKLGGESDTNDNQNESKPKAKDKQNESKEEPNCKNSASDKDKDKDKEKDNDKDKGNIITPLTPLTGEWNYDKHSNLENVKHLLNHESYKDADYIREHKQLWESIKTWMEYKDAKKPRSSNHYANDKSITALLNKFVENCKAHGEQAVATAVDDTLAAGYQGIVWWKIKDTTDDWSKIV